MTYVGVTGGGSPLLLAPMRRYHATKLISPRALFKMDYSERTEKVGCLPRIVVGTQPLRLALHTDGPMGADGLDTITLAYCCAHWLSTEYFLPFEPLKAL